MGASPRMDKLTGCRKRRRRGIGVAGVEDTIGGAVPAVDPLSDVPSTSHGTVQNESSLHQSALLDELDEEIDRQLKARKTVLTVNYVKNLIKAVMNTQNLLVSNNLTLNMAGKISLKPILTRAKIRELLAKEYNLLIYPKPLHTNDPDIAELITKELPDDSSDEEYHPNDVSDDESNRIKLSQNEENNIESNKTESNNKPNSDTLIQINNLTDENIGQRTRSKLCLSETPLEAIEQAFIPPDITKDMYNLECENPDWFDFLKEFTQPLNVTQNPENIDDENDPEYNAVDEEHEDLEELRMDSEVKVSKKELNALMKELWEYNQMICSDDDDDDVDETTDKKKVGTKEKDKEERERERESLNKDLNYKPSSSFDLNNENEILFDDKNESNIHNIDIIKNESNIHNIDIIKNEILSNDKNENTNQIDSNNENEIVFDNKNEIIEVFIKPEVSLYEEQNENEPEPLWYKEQKLLFQQQLKQHIQLLASYYLLSHKHPFIDENYSKEYKSMILFWKERIVENENNEDTIFIQFLKHVIHLIKAWDNIMNDPVHYKKIDAFVKEEFDKVIVNQKRRRLYRPALPPEMITICKESRAFLYPLLLPSNGFVQSHKQNFAISDSEAMLFVIGWDQYNLIFGVDKSCKFEINKMIKYLAENKLPVWNKNTLQHFFKRSLQSDKPNVIKLYYKTNQYSEMNHFIIPLSSKMLKLKHQSHQLIPEKWRTYLKSV